MNNKKLITIIILIIIMIILAGFNLKDHDKRKVCPDQTISRSCKTGKVNYQEPIMNGITKYNSFTKKQDRCVYLYDADNKHTSRDYYECDTGDDIHRYNSKTNKEVISN